ncbi:MAG: triphosphoribosyl-dephospho-CoA synthase [Candidatus Ranarchaeia archaeon]
MKYSVDAALDRVMMAAQTAAMLEVAGTPKPGNVHRTRDFWDTRFEHFLAGGVALGPAIRRVASRGAFCKQHGLPLNEVKIGKAIFDAVSSVQGWHHGANTHLGTVMLLTPLAAAAGLSIPTDSLDWNIKRVQDSADRIMKATTVEDAIYIYRTLAEIGYSRHGKVETTEAPDAFDEDAIVELRSRGLTLYDVMAASAPYDRIADEMVNGFPVTFSIGVKAFRQAWGILKDVNMTTIHVFLRILSELPDLLVARKVGLQYTSNVEKAVKLGMPQALEISKAAKRALESGGFKTQQGRQLVRELDRHLHSRRNLLNPGSTADITATTLMIMLLNGWRP